jgi:iron complex transport system ATP-binding protein
VISINNLNFNYGNNFSLNIDSLDLEKNLLHVIIGPNGSGKSTFVKIISKIISNYNGSIKIDDSDLKDFKYKELSRKITYMNRRLIRNYNISVFDFISLGRFPHKNSIFFSLDNSDNKKVYEVLDMVDLKNKQKNMLYELSDGEVQRAYLAKSLCQETEYTILDEPTANLDIKHIKEFLELIKSLKQNTTFIVILHNINEAIQIFDKLIAFDSGKISFIWKGIKDFNLQKLENLYKVDLDYIVEKEKHIVYF